MQHSETQEETLAVAIDRVDDALRAMWRGDPEPYMALWAHRDDVTLMGALGPVERGWRDVGETFRWVGAKFKDGSESTIERIAVGESGDLAYSIGYERRTARLDDGALEERTLRVTHLYRRIEGLWCLIHRHADVPPVDPRKAGKS